VTVELKNDISIRGTLKSVDQYLNIKLDDISVVDDLKYPHLVRSYAHDPWEDSRRNKSILKTTTGTKMPSIGSKVERHRLTLSSSQQSSVRNVFIRGSVVRYVHLSSGSVDTALLEDATRRGMQRYNNNYQCIVNTANGFIQKLLRPRQKQDKVEMAEETANFRATTERGHWYDTDKKSTISAAGAADLFLDTARALMHITQSLTHD